MRGYNIREILEKLKLPHPLEGEVQGKGRLEAQKKMFRKQ
jgi:hypothetical protein